MPRHSTCQSNYDVFLSHHSADKHLVERLAAQLEDKEGLKPFLDKWHLVPGESWQEGLEEALNNSDTCAVFLGPNGVGAWENEEMRSALDERTRNKAFRVIPVLLPGANLKNPATLPRFLRRLTWVDFRSGLDNPEAFCRLVAGIRGAAPGRGVMVTSLNTHRGRNYSILLLILPTLLVIMAALGLIIWRFPTRIRVDLSVNRVSFTVNGIGSKPILNSVPLRSLTVDKFDQIVFSPDKLEVADPTQYKLFEDRYPETAWKLITVISKIKITGREKAVQPSITFEAVDKRSVTGWTLDQVWARPGSDVSLEVSGSKTTSVTVKIDRQESSAAFSVSEPFQLIANYCLLNGASPSPFQTGSLTYRARLSNHSPEIEVKGLPNSVVYTLELPPENNNELFSKDGIQVSSISFTDLSDTGNPITSLVSSGEITYPDYPGVEKVSFAPPDLFWLDRLEIFYIEKMAMDPETHAIRLRLHGIAGRVSSGSHEFARDHRLTRFDSLRQNPRLIALFGFLIWTIPTALGGYRFYREFKEGDL